MCLTVIDAPCKHKDCFRFISPNIVTRLTFVIQRSCVVCMYLQDF